MNFVVYRSLISLAGTEISHGAVRFCLILSAVHVIRLEVWNTLVM